MLASWRNPIARLRRDRTGKQSSASREMKNQDVFSWEKPSLGHPAKRDAVWAVPATHGHDRAARTMARARIRAGYSTATLTTSTPTYNETSRESAA